nr:MAG TPA: hypothetical protein [Caudoviricetes sp.]
MVFAFHIFSPIPICSFAQIVTLKILLFFNACKQ